MARTLIKAPAVAKRGESVEIRTLIQHPMETGFRPGADGKILPRNIIRRFACYYNEVLVFEAELFSAIAANPYLNFYTLATESGTLRLQWEGDNGFSQTESLAIAVTD
jgi:sulfur-oxidizing protein SoxZ